VINELLPWIFFLCADMCQQLSPLGGESSQDILLIGHRFSDRNLYFLRLQFRFLFLNYVRCGFVRVLRRSVIL
jgi:hypothetical protein